MSKFKAGDRVVVVRSTHNDEVYLCKRGEVVRIEGTQEYEVGVRLDGMGLTNFDTAELEFEHVYDALRAKPDVASTIFNERDLLACAVDGEEKSAPADDVVNHPSHYADGWSNGAEVIDLTEHLNFSRGNAVKYLCRASRKGGPEKELEDLQKALWYVKREIRRLGGSVD
jgi:hypothetical protein